MLKKTEKYFNYFLLSKLNYQKWGAMQQSDSKMMQSTKIQTTAEISKKNTLINFSMSKSKKLYFKNNLTNFSIKNLNHKKKSL